MSVSSQQFIEERVVVDGVRAIRKQKARAPVKAKELYLHISMRGIEAMTQAKLPANAWALAIWIVWRYMVTKKPAVISAEFALRAGIVDRSGRRYAIDALEASGLFIVTRSGKLAAKVSPSDGFAKLLRTNGN